MVTSHIPPNRSTLQKMSTQQCLATVVLDAYYWRPEFSNGQPHGYQAQNTRYVETTSHIQPNISLVDDLIRAFFSILGDGGAPHGPSGYQRPEVESFCAPGPLSQLEHGSDSHGQVSRALLDDRCRVTSQPGGQRRHNRGPLNPTQLLKELKKKRYGCDDEPDAARRLLYVADPDSWVIIALMLTSSHQQALFLTDFFYKYLGLGTSLGIHIPPRGFPVFALEFHLHFYVWRDSGPTREDWRTKRNGQPLRKSRQLRDLGPESQDGDANISKINIHEAQVSCLITGLDHDSWVAYMFVDTYYQSGDLSESAEQYYSRTNLQYQPDPLQCGNTDANFPIWTPREYFLTVYESRLGQVNHALHTVVSRLVLRIEPYMEDAMDLLNGEGTLSFERKKQVHQIAGEAIRLLRQTIHSISSAVEVWDRFSNQDAAYLDSILESRGNQHDSRGIPPIGVVALIVHHINDMKDLQRRAEEQRGLCSGAARELEIQISMEDNENSNQQQRTGEFVKMLTGIGMVSQGGSATWGTQSQERTIKTQGLSTQLFIPFTATAAILSMQPGVLPPELVSGKTFLACWASLTVLVATGIFWNGLFSLTQLVESFVFGLHWLRMTKGRHVRRVFPVGPPVSRATVVRESDMYTDDIELNPVQNPQGPLQ